MHYFTYRNLFRIRPAITAIGEGQHKIRLPRGFQITLDMFVLTVVLWLPFSFIIGSIVKFFIDLPLLLIGAVISFIVSLRLEKIDPAGKSVILYLADFLKFLTRTKYTNGFAKQRKTSSWRKSSNNAFSVTLVEDNGCTTLPVKGYPTTFKLNNSCKIKIESDGHITIIPNDKKRKGFKTYTQGKYYVTPDKKIKKIQAPSI